jgi:hypothetical protein
MSSNPDVVRTICVFWEHPPHLSGGESAAATPCVAMAHLRRYPFCCPPFRKRGQWRIILFTFTSFEGIRSYSVRLDLNAEAEAQTATQLATSAALSSSCCIKPSWVAVVGWSAWPSVSRRAVSPDDQARQAAKSVVNAVSFRRPPRTL